MSNEQIYHLLLENTTKLSALESAIQADVASLRHELVVTQEKCSSAQSLFLDYSSKTDTMLATIVDEQQRYKLITNQLLRDKLVVDVIMTNVPMVSGESSADLRKIFYDISDVIGFQLKDSLATIFRLNSARSSTSSYINSPKILLKFNSASNKHRFMKCYFQFKTLDLTAIGLATPSRIYCNDNLLPSDAAIFKEALLQKKNNKIHAVRIKNGKIYVWLRSVDSEPIHIHTMADLRNHIASL